MALREYHLRIEPYVRLLYIVGDCGTMCTELKKKDDIKVRVDALTKSAFVQIANDEGLELSDIVRFALRDYLDRRVKQRDNSKQPAYG